MQIPQTEVVALVDGREIFRELLPPGEYLIGREVEAQIRLDSNKVSCRHALLTLNYFEWTIEDYGSTNGTRVGGEPVTERAPIFPQQAVQVGNVDLQLRRLRMSEAGDTLAPQTAAVLRYLPSEVRGERKYKVKGVIAVGGMGIVLEAEDVATRRSVAMKTLRKTRSAEDIARFIEEAQITAQLEHPNIVPIYELNVNDLDLPFYTMKLVRGESLRQVLERLRLERAETVEQYPLGELLGIFQKVCDAIAFAHSKGVVHRDLKPDNILLGKYGATVVMDWGLAKLLGQRAAGLAKDFSSTTLVTSARADDPGGVSTMKGLALGTPQFMSPEQASGESHTVDAPADIYGLGAILYNILTLRPPIEGADAQEVLENVVRGAITPPEKAVEGLSLLHLPEGRLPADLIETALQAMALRPKDRFASVGALQAEIREFQNGERKRSALFGVEGLFRGRKAKS